MPGQVRRDDFETRLQRAYQWQKVLELGTKWLHQHDRRPRDRTLVSEITVTKTQRLLSHRMSSLHVLIPRPRQNVHTRCQMNTENLASFLAPRCLA